MTNTSYSTKNDKGRLSPTRSSLSPQSSKSIPQSPQFDYPRSPSPLTLTSNLPHNPQIRISESGSPHLHPHNHIKSMDDLIFNSRAHMKPEIANKVKLKYYNQALISYLAGQGLNMNPLKLPNRQLSLNSYLTSSQSEFHSINSTLVKHSNLETFITGNGQILFLPFNQERKRRRRHHIHDEYNDDDVDDDINDIDIDNENENDNENDDDVNTDYYGSFQEGSGISLNSNNIGTPSILPNLSSLYNKLGSKGSENATYHTFGIIIKLRKSLNLNTKVKVNYHAHASLKYDAPEYVKHLSVDERYRISKVLDWDLDLTNPDCFIPFPKIDDDNESNSENTDDSITSDSSFSAKGQNDMSFSDTPTQKIKVFTPLQPKDYASEPLSLRNSSNIESNLFANSTSTASRSKICEPGYYVYLLPVVYPVKTPETTFSPYSSISHDISIQIQKGTVSVPTLQPPQSAFLSSSPSHHHRFDENTDFTGGSPPDSFLQSSKSSFLKKIGIRRNSTSSNKSESSSKFNPTSPRSMFDISGPLSRSRASSNAVLNPINHKLNSVTLGINDFSYELPAVRLPPSDATSTINKSIYVNKIWNDSLNYELLLPRKYIQLSPPASLNVGQNNKYLKENTFLLQIKLVPLIKNLQLKRIKVNIVEKITYFDKSSLLKNSKKPKGRTIDKVVTMLEVKTKDRHQTNQPASTIPLKTQIIKGCENDNLLTFCYDTTSNKTSRAPKEHEHAMSRSSSNSNKLKQASASLFQSAKKMSKVLDNTSTENQNITKEDVIITNPVKLQCPLSFTANDDSNFIAGVYDNLCKSTSYVTALQDESTTEKFSDSLSIFSINSDNEVEESDVSRSPDSRKRGFSFASTTANNWESIDNDDARKSHSFIPDVSLPHLKVRHRLQLSFRISKKDEKVKSQDGDPKMHHYEVIVDTPLIFVSPFCVDDTLDLPSYEDAVKTSIFEADRTPPGFLITKTDSSLLSDETDSSLSGNEQYATLTPCSPLMKDGGSFPFSLSSTDISSNDQITNLVIGSPLLEPADSIINNRRKSDLLANGSIPVNATSLLSAAFSRSKERSNSLQNALAVDLSSLSLTSSNSHLNTIDSVMCERAAAPPPQYSTIRMTSNLSDLMKKPNNDSPPSYDTSFATSTKPLSPIKPEVPFIHKIESKASLMSENVGLLHNNIDDRSSIPDCESQISECKSMNLDSLNDIDAIINMSSNNIATLNMTPTRND